MKRNIAYRYRAYPDKLQAILLQKTFGCTRFIWNQMLADIKAYYEKEQKALNPTPAQYKADHAWLKEVDSLALANVQLQLKKAFQRFFSDERWDIPGSSQSITTRRAIRQIW